MARTGLVRSKLYRRHFAGHGHPERPQRLEAIDRHLEESGLLARLSPIEPAPAEPRWLETLHAAAYIQHIEQACRAGGQPLDDMDTGICRESFETALLAVGGALALVDAVLTGRVRNGFAAIRPPGHHAERTHAMGFCLFNNVGVAARYAQRRHGLERILILDWDVHHGNGTQHAFEEDASVLYCSLHQYPHYPGTGAGTERGRGAGLGFTLNLPMAAGTGDGDWLEAVDRHLIPRANEFRPELILISAGFDAHVQDPLSQTRLSASGFAALSDRVLALAERHCDGRLACLLEGGYHLQGLADSVAAHLERLLAA
ncbi:MAG: histone deacetylase [Acidobacteriota bacterium]